MNKNNTIQCWMEDGLTNIPDNFLNMKFYPRTKCFQGMSWCCGIIFLKQKNIYLKKGNLNNNYQ